MFFQLVNSSASFPSLVATFVAIVVAFVLGIGFHEFSHVFVAYLLGDTTGRDLGRLTLNPLRHLDPMGSFMLLFFGFGWGKPAPVNPNRLKTGPDTGFALVALAGPISNFLIAAVFALLLRLFAFQLQRSVWGEFLLLVILASMSINILLGVFNLLPVPPLDGYRVALRLLPPDLAAAYRRIEPYGMFILFALFALPFVTGSRFNPVGDFIGTASGWVRRLLLGA